MFQSNKTPEGLYLHTLAWRRYQPSASLRDVELLAEQLRRSSPGIIGVVSGSRAELCNGANRSPVLFVDGDPNPGSMVTNRAAEYNVAMYPWADRIQLQGVDHRMGLYDDPSRVIAEALRFLEDPVGGARNTDWRHRIGRVASQ